VRLHYHRPHQIYLFSLFAKCPVCHRRWQDGYDLQDNIKDLFWIPMTEVKP